MGAGDGSMTGMGAARLDRLSNHAAIFLAGGGHHPSQLLVLATALVALVAVASSRIWPVARTVVTIAHEGGHALTALLTGLQKMIERRFITRPRRVTSILAQEHG